MNFDLKFYISIYGILLAWVLLVLFLFKNTRTQRSHPFNIKIPFHAFFQSWIAPSCFLFFLVIFIQFSLFKIQGKPIVDTNDEFSYLMAGETYYSGRFVNPVPPLVKPFQINGVIIDTHFYSKYQPAQGLSIALGFLLGNPLYGIWLVLSLAHVVLFWILKHFWDSLTAFLVVALISSHPLILAWGQCYWGGGIPLLGGTLVWGGWFLYFFKQRRSKTSTLTGIGFVILFFSRPYEASILLLLMGCCSLAYAYFYPTQMSFKATFSYLFIVGFWFVFIVLLQIFYNLKTTGNPLLPPYLKHEHLYCMLDGPFIWSQIRSQIPSYPSHLMEFDYKIYDQYPTATSLSKTFYLISKRTNDFLISYFSIPFLFLIFFSIRKKYSHQALFGILPLLISLATSFIIRWYWPHYTAPFFFILIMLYGVAMSQLHQWLASKIPQKKNLITLLVFLTMFYNIGSSVFIKSWHLREETWAKSRDRIMQLLEQKPYDSLILVRYPDEVLKLSELPPSWVQNGADLFHSKIIWAMDNSPDESQQLIKQYPARKVFRLTVLSPHEFSFVVVKPLLD